MENNVIPCPACGTLMNHHADKLVYVLEREEADEVIEEFHRCPNCGAGLSRRKLGPR